MVQTISSQKSEQIRDGEEAKDLILDIQFDAFGKRFATASSDQKIRVSSFSRTVLWYIFGTLSNRTNFALHRGGLSVHAGISRILVTGRLKFKVTELQNVAV